ncbi:MAG: Acg family FMN-binding oxidoreductase [Acidobacteriota bacterium]
MHDDLGMLPISSALEAAQDPTFVLRNAAAAAVMAPSSHNTQPWRFRIVDSTLELLADPARQLHVIDPERRQLVVSCGCALFNARVAVRAMGFADEVTIMLAERERPELLATLHLGARIITSDADLELVRAIALRHTNRRPFLARPVALADSDRLAAAAEREGAWMVRLMPDQKHVLGDLIDDADRMQYADPAFRAELARWLVSSASRRRDGIPFREKEYGSVLPFAVTRALRSPELGRQFGRTEEQLVDASPIVAVLGTSRDEPSEWLACGQALQAVLLHATSLGLAAAFVNQSLELPELRRRIATITEHVGMPHMMLRLGYPAAPIAHAAPRRDLDDVLEVAPSRDAIDWLATH